jgi:hypothetical protein
MAALFRTANRSLPAGEAGMAGNRDSLGREVVLGMDAAWGFSPADQTSPALAADAGALMDVSMTGPPVTELRIHGVSGSDGPTMLEHPTALQVAGDGITGFYRRWNPDGPGRPSVPWRLEAYSWGGLTEQPLAATVQFVGAAVALTVSTVAWQAAGRAGLLPGWMGWYGGWPAGWRVALALAAVAAVVAGLWAASALTAHHYETRATQAEPGQLSSTGCGADPPGLEGAGRRSGARPCRWARG